MGGVAIVIACLILMIIGAAEYGREWGRQQCRNETVIAAVKEMTFILDDEEAVAVCEAVADSYDLYQ